MELLLIGLLVIALGWFVWHKRSQRSSNANASRNKGKGRSLEALDTVASWPPQATRVLTTPERKVFNSLRLSLPDHIILAQVPLARFLKVPTRYSYSEWLRRVGLMCADLVVCDSSSQVIAVIDIRPPATQETERTRQRNERMDRVIRGANIPVHVWREDALPTATAARNAILQLPPGTPMDAPLKSTPPLHAATSLEPPIDDDVIEQGEPPPSTWFDDLESAPVPLTPVKPVKPASIKGNPRAY